MMLGRVTGNVVASQKYRDYDATKLLIVQPVDLDGTDLGEEVLAVDGVDAGPGDTVLLVQDGYAASMAAGKAMAAIDIAVIGVVDEVKFFPAANHDR
jgi:ethanolamine utilization protein EutN